MLHSILWKQSPSEINTLAAKRFLKNRLVHSTQGRLREVFDSSSFLRHITLSKTKTSDITLHCVWQNTKGKKKTESFDSRSSFSLFAGRNSTTDNGVFILSLYLYTVTLFREEIV